MANGDLTIRIKAKTFLTYTRPASRYSQQLFYEPYLDRYGILCP